MFSRQPHPGITYGCRLPTAFESRYGQRFLYDRSRATIPRRELYFINRCLHRRGSVLGPSCSPRFLFSG